MAIRWRPFVVSLVLFCASHPAIQASARTPSSAGPAIAFENAAVIPMDRERVLRDQTVVVAEGVIVAIGPASRVKVPRGAIRVDARGRYLLPALCDMHVHLPGEAWNALLSPDAQAAAKAIPFERFLFPYVASGVTTVQALSATPQEITIRGEIARGSMIGPRLILARMIDGPKKAWPPPLSTWVDSATEASDAVRQAKGAGYDKIKVYSFLSKESYDAIIAAARETRMDVIGHVPMALSVEYVIDAGQKMIAHTEEIAKHTHGDYSPERIDYYAGRIAGGGVWMTPTLVTTRTILELFDDQKAVLGRPEAAYFGDPMQAGISAFIANNLYAPIPADARRKIRSDFEKFQRPLTKVVHDKHGRLMTGTDSLLPGLGAGFALHRELHELVDVGLTPYEALRTSTTAPFEYLGEIDRAGTIEVGKRPDLILVDANPLEDVSAAAKISGVLLRGRWIPKTEIDRRMGEIAAAAP